MKKYLTAIVILLFLAVSAIADPTDNPTGASRSDRNMNGETLTFTGGSPRFSIYTDDGSGGYDYRGITSVTNPYVFVVNWMQPNSSIQVRVAGQGNSAAQGVNFTVWSGPVPSGPFADVNSQHWAANHIKWFSDAGITSGCGNNNFCPNAEVTRDQMAVFFCNYHKAFVDPNSNCATAWIDQN